MTYRQPVYTLTVRFFEDCEPVCSCAGLQAVLDKIPRLEPNLYAVHLEGRDVGTIARHESGWWTLTLEFAGRVDEEPPRVGPSYAIV